jgi:hypothetical protein
MSNEEFDNLKEELMWEGSKVIMLSKWPSPFPHGFILVSVSVFHYSIVKEMVHVYAYLEFLIVTGL